MEYSGILAEHNAVRTAAGLFDVSHMGEIQFRGHGALAAVQAITMNDASALKDGQAQYSALLTPEGTFVDDILVHRLGENDYLLVVNAGTREKDYRYIRAEVGTYPGVHIADYSDYYTQLAIQGPQALRILSSLTEVDLASIRNYWFTWGKVLDIPNVLIARTGYTGEDGFELYLPSDQETGERVWGELMTAGKDAGLIPCGLGARNTLRLEAGMPLYGHELSEEINVFEAGLTRFLKLDKGDFVGVHALRRIQEGGVTRKLAGLEMTGRGIAREGYRVLDKNGAHVGTVTSGSPAPFLKKNIALAYLPPELTAPGTELAVEVRANPVDARVVATPFYRRKRDKKA